VVDLRQSRRGVVGANLDAARATLQNNALDLIERDLVVAAVVEHGRAGAFMRRHLLGVLEQAAVEQIDGDAGGAEAVAPKPCDDAGLQGAADDQPARILAGHAVAG